MKQVQNFYQQKFEINVKHLENKVGIQNLLGEENFWHLASQILAHKLRDTANPSDVSLIFFSILSSVPGNLQMKWLIAAIDYIWPETTKLQVGKL